MRPVAAIPILLAAFALPAGAHEVHAEVRRDGAVAVRAETSGGGHVADAVAEVYSPADPSTPFWKGRTDRNGWVAFVPEAPGRWRVRIVDATGHGVDTRVEVPAPGATAPRAAADAGEGGKAESSLLHSLLAIAAVGAVFGMLVLAGRKKGG